MKKRLWKKKKLEFFSRIIFFRFIGCTVCVYCFVLLKTFTYRCNIYSDFFPHSLIVRAHYLFARGGFNTQLNVQIFFQRCIYHPRATWVRGLHLIRSKSFSLLSQHWVSRVRVSVYIQTEMVKGSGVFTAHWQLNSITFRKSCTSTRTYNINVYVYREREGRTSVFLVHWSLSVYTRARETGTTVVVALSLSAVYAAPLVRTVIIMVDLLDVCRNYFGLRRRRVFVLHKIRLNKTFRRILMQKLTYLTIPTFFFQTTYRKMMYFETQRVSR